MRIWTAFACIASLAASSPLLAQEASAAELLFDMLTGEFDSFKQSIEDELADVPEGEVHGWINRTLQPIDAPDIGELVLLGSAKYGPLPWTRDEYEFIAFTLTDRPDGTVLMHPRQFKNREELFVQERQPEKFSGFTADQLEPAESGSACDLVWTRTEAGFSALSEPCRRWSVYQKTLKDWVWHYRVDKDALSIMFFGTEVMTGKTQGTPQVYYRLDRIEGPAEFEAGRFLLLGMRNKADYERSIKLLEAAVENNPEHAAANLYLAYALGQQVRFGEAAPYLAAARSASGDLTDHERLLLQVVAARAAGSFAAEVSAVEALVAAYPEDRWAWYERMLTYYRAEDYEPTLDSIGRALELEPDPAKWAGTVLFFVHPKALSRLGRHEEAIAASRAGLAFPERRRAVQFRQAIDRIALGGDVDEALESYAKAMRETESYDEGLYHTNSAVLLYEAGRIDAAVEQAREGYRLTSSAYSAVVLGYFLAETGKSNEAAPILAGQLAASPDNVPLLMAAGWTDYRLGEPASALSHLQRAQKLIGRHDHTLVEHLRVVAEVNANPDTPQVARLRWLIE